MSTMYEVRFVSKRVQKELDQFHSNERAIIESALKVLRMNPRPTDLDYGSITRCSEIKKISIKRVRIFYTIDEAKKVVIIGKLENRGSHTYGDQIDPREWFRKIAA